jgi:hypothetical protein
MNRVQIITLLPIPIKNGKIPQNQLDQSQPTTRERLHIEPWQDFQPPAIKHNASTGSWYYGILCADENFRYFESVLAVSHADCSEYSALHHLEWQVSIAAGLIKRKFQ